jgi:integrase
MYVFKRGKFFWFEFEFRGERIRQSAKVTNANDARTIGAAYRTLLAKGEVGIKTPTVAPTLKRFLENDYKPYIAQKHAGKVHTLNGYTRGVKWLLKSEMAELPLNEITNQHATHFAAQHADWSASGVNQVLRVLIMALRIANEWGKLAVLPRIKMLPGEVKRDRVLTASEQADYLAACEQPWKDIATIMLNTGMRPCEVRSLTWDRVNLDTRLLSITRENTKSDNGVRRLPLLDAAYNSILARWEAQGKPKSGWLFPSPMSGKKGCLGQGYNRHASALAASKVKPFVPYTMRHTALTALGMAGVDLKTLSVIAGHYSISMTQRYVHPQVENVQAAFAKLGAHKNPHTLEIVPAQNPVKSAA